MKAHRGLAWLEVFLIGGIATLEAKEKTWDFPHLHQEVASGIELNPAWSDCELFVTGSFRGPTLTFKGSAPGSFPSISVIGNRDDYDGGSLCFH
ncbi:MAG: hypothetical protein ACLQU1_17110 [Bryobacteraceae bacterium]